MINFHGEYKTKNFFEGWYFKHQKNENTIAFIPGINIDSDGNKSAFIQVITNTNSYNIKYLYSDFEYSKDELEIRIGKNIFSKEGIEINIKDKDLSILGKIKYDKLTPIEYDIMGPFRSMPFMECNHGIISLYHKISGNIKFNNKDIDLKNGVGYIEKDWGSSFPKEYLWIQCNYFKNHECSIMVSIADIPFMGMNFRGCICSVYYEGEEYRLATYNGVKIINCSNKSVLLKRGKYKLKINFSNNNAQSLLAPNKGSMSRRIQENAACRGRFEFYIDDELIFNLYSNNCSFEYLEK